ncbi:MAG TPA: ribosome small subunit-dependent GTPase A [Anaerolineales bacterium]|nr:ribosome small subunit-dependent GTPase A [Anaerolineales bacterium]
MPPDRQLLPGLIIKTQSGFFTVESETGTLVCKLRGRLKQGKAVGNLAAIGDRVLVRKLEAGRGLIEKIEPRLRMLSRQAPTPRGVYQQIIIANPDQAIFVFACADPAPRLRMLDRFLVIAEKQELPAIIVANKVDLVDEERGRELLGHYAEIGYLLIFTSAKTGKGVPAVKEALAGKISVLAGPSGAGKSSLLNAIQPGLGLSVRQISQATRKGRHTTVSSAMFPLESGGYVADTPGLKALALWDIEAEELDGYFPELKPLVEECQFNDCTHLHEPGCAVQAAVQEGRVHPERYESYMRLRLGEE